MTAYSDVWLFKEGLAIRIVGLAVWPDVADQQAKALNASLTNAQKGEGYEYRAIRR